MDFWNTRLGVDLAETLIRTLPNLADGTDKADKVLNELSSINEKLSSIEKKLETIEKRLDERDEPEEGIDDR